VAARARAGAAEGLVAVADHQWAGRGRRGRTWEAPAGTALLCSVLLRPDLDPARRPLAAAAVAVAAADACAAQGPAVALKWPNDLVVGDAKLGGVLAEDHGGAVVVGLGVNLTWSPPGAARLGPVDGDGLLAAVLAGLGRLVGDWPAVAAAHRRRCATVGREVRVELPGGSCTGRAVDLSDEGHLVVDTAGGRRTFSAADVVHLRPRPASPRPAR